MGRTPDPSGFTSTRYGVIAGKPILALPSPNGVPMGALSIISTSVASVRSNTSGRLHRRRPARLQAAKYVIRLMPRNGGHGGSGSSSKERRGIGWHWLWFGPLCVVVLWFFETYAVAHALQVTTLFFHRWNWLVPLFPRHRVFLRRGYGLGTSTAGRANADLLAPQGEKPIPGFCNRDARGCSRFSVPDRFRDLDIISSAC